MKLEFVVPCFYVGPFEGQLKIEFIIFENADFVGFTFRGWSKD